MIQSFREGKDIYASIASIAFKVPYEKCLEFHPETGEYQPDGKARRGEAKFIVLGICYGRSVPSIGEQLYGHRDDMTEEEKTKEAQKVFDSVMNSFPNLRSLMVNTQAKAKKLGYTETILGRRRHLPNMQLPEFEFKAKKNYVNPDIDPLDITTLEDKSQIPDRIVKQLEKEFSNYKYFGQIARRTRELYEEGIQVINNRAKINDSTRQCVNCVDYETEILTTSGWKRHDEIQVGDNIFAYSLDKHKIIRDKVLNVFHYDGLYETYLFENSSFSAVSTLDHRWVVDIDGKDIQVVTTSDMLKRKDCSILRVDVKENKNKHFTNGSIEVYYDFEPNYDIVQILSDGIWCVETNSSTWVARRKGHTYITGNSVIQGSAADQTKMAILELENNPEWKAIGGRLLCPVHDELIAEVPIEYWKEGGEFLSKCMCNAADFLPFPSKCDVTTTLRWYGIEYPCPYTKPTSMTSNWKDELSEDEIKWIQYHLYDLETVLPVFKNEDGSKPRGDAALGVNGIWSKELESAVNSYLSRREITEEEFVDDIEYRVVNGIYRERN